MKIQSALLAGVVVGCAATLASAEHSALSFNADGSYGTTGGVAGTTNTIINVDISGRNSWDLFAVQPGPPSAFNEVVLVDLAAALGLAPGSTVTMVSIGWNTNQQVVTASSWLSEMRIYFDDNVAPNSSGLFLRPGAAVANNNGGAAANFNSGGQIDLSANNIPNIVLPDGILRLDFHETFDDVAGAIDGTFLANSVLNIGVLEVVPAPGALALLGLAGLAGSRRRRS